MEQKSILKEFIKYTTENVLGMLGLSFYILVDTYFIAKGMGADGLTALNLAIPVYSMIHGSGLMMGIGGATKYSIFQGQKNQQAAQQVFSGTVYMAILFAMIFMLIGVLFGEGITHLLGADASVFPLTYIYIRTLLLFAPGFLMNDILVSFVRNDGNPGLSMAAMIVGSLSNVVLDYIFIFPLQLGMFGAVLATGFAPLISMGILSLHWIRKKNHFEFRKEKTTLSLQGSILSLGLPSLIAELASGIVILVFNFIIMDILGNIGVAAYGIVANLSLVVTAVFTGIAQGMQPLLSRAYGEQGGEGKLKCILKYGIFTLLPISLLIYLLLFCFADPVAGIFNEEQNAELQQIAITGLRLYFIGIPLAGFNIILSMYFTSVEKAVPAQILSILRGLILIIPMAFFLSKLAGMEGVWLSYPVTEGLVCLLGGLFYYRRKGTGIFSRL